MTLNRPLTEMELSIIDDRRDLLAAQDAVRRARGEDSQLTGVCACGRPAAKFYLSECVACQLDRIWRDSSDFALLTYTEPTAMLHAFLWHWLGLDSAELRLAFVSFALGRVQMLDNLADITEAEREQIYDLVNGWQVPGGAA